jgi:hypothetical protein
MIEVRCKVCEKGNLDRRKKFRMSGPVVAIGYIFLVPSILGVMISAFMFISTAALHPSNSADPGTSAAVTGIAGGIAIAFGIASFVGGLIGWLLVMKKQVLECNVCKATVNAS